MRVALASELRARLENLRRMQPLMLLVGRAREHLGPANDRLGDRLVEHNLKVRSDRLARWTAADAIPERDPEALAGVVLGALTGYHLSRAYFARPPGGLSEDALIETLVELVAGRGDGGRPDDVTAGVDGGTDRP